MLVESLAIQSLAAFFITVVLIIFGAPIARKVRLTDSPTSRKFHVGEVPTIGGIAIFIALVIAWTGWSDKITAPITVAGSQTLEVFIGCGAFLVVTGVLDDRFHLGVFVRILSELLVAIAVIELLDLELVYLGDLFGSGLVQMSPIVAYPFTVIAIFGIINAFNMIDGMDGLLASLVIATLVLFHIVTTTQPGFLSLTIGAALLGFLVSNLSLSPFVPKTFLGDAGSKLLGFIVACFLLAAASAQVGGIKLIQPVTALFIVALPLYDMVFTSLRRLFKKGSPFVADRSHIHHLMQDLGFSDRRSLIILLGIHCSAALIGLVLHLAEAAEYYQFAIFVGCFGLYSLLSSQLWLAAIKMQDAQARLADTGAPNVNETTNGVIGHSDNIKSPTNVSPGISQIKRR